MKIVEKILKRVEGLLENPPANEYSALTQIERHELYWADWLKIKPTLNGLNRNQRKNQRRRLKIKYGVCLSHSAKMRKFKQNGYAHIVTILKNEFLTPPTT